MIKNIKMHIPLNLLINLLNGICESNNIFHVNKYIFQKNKTKIECFLSSIRNYYYELNVTNIEYTYFLTIVRQICNINKVNYHFKIKYIKNNYEIHYFINNPYFSTHYFPNK
jgi:hypothetical protein